MSQRMQKYLFSEKRLEDSKDIHKIHLNPNAHLRHYYKCNMSKNCRKDVKMTQRMQKYLCSEKRLEYSKDIHKIRVNPNVNLRLYYQCNMSKNCRKDVK